MSCFSSGKNPSWRAVMRQCPGDGSLVLKVPAGLVVVRTLAPSERKRTWTAPTGTLFSSTTLPLTGTSPAQRPGVKQRTPKALRTRNCKTRNSVTVLCQFCLNSIIRYQSYGRKRHPTVGPLAVRAQKPLGFPGSRDQSGGSSGAAICTSHNIVLRTNLKKLLLVALLAAVGGIAWKIVR